MTVLDDIIVGVREDLELRRLPFEAVVAAAFARGPGLAVVDQLRGSELSVISEVKRSSPSKGQLAEIVDPAALALAYQDGGASAVSVLTEQRRFHGSLADLDLVRERIQIPILRKDFVVDEYQLYEGRAHGADLALLIVAALTDAELSRFLAINAELGVTSLVEVHTENEVRRAVSAGAEVIGVNNRNLKTLAVDIAQFERLAHLIPDSTVRIAESGIFTPADVRRVVAAGANGILVGEALVKSGDPRSAIQSFIAAAR